MTELSEADLIWNRACGQGPPGASPGDRALADLLYAHGLTMNGRVLHAVECKTRAELAAADAGYRYFNLDEVAAFLSRAHDIYDAAEDLANDEHELNHEYARLVPSDCVLFDCFLARLRSSPAAFEPVARSHELSNAEAHPRCHTHP